MTLTAYDASISLFVRGLTGLKIVVNKTAMHASSHGLTELECLAAQLAPDMHNFGTQVHWAAQGPCLAAARLCATEPFTWPDDAKSCSELQARLDGAIEHLNAVSRDELEAGLDRWLHLEHRGPEGGASGQGFLTAYVIPTFYFHLTNAYAIARHRGVDLNKNDFLGKGG